MPDLSAPSAAVVDLYGEREAFERSLLPITRAAGLLGAVLVLVLFPLWGWFDAVLEPAIAPQLIRVRWMFMVPIGLAALGIWLGGERPIPLYLSVTALLALPAIAIAWMIARVSNLEAYLIGFSLLITATGALMVLPMRWTLTVLLACLGSVAAMLWQPQRPQQEIAIIVFFLGTVTVVNGTVAWFMWRVRLAHFRTLNELESRRREAHVLLQEVVRLSNEDDLTGLANRRRFRRELDEAVASDTALSVAIVDMDNFKSINDLHGHHLGDAALVAVAQVIGAEFASSGTAARLGGDEFAVLLRDGGDALVERVARVQQRVASGTDAELQGVEVSLSFGVAERLPGESAHALLRRADQALYAAKRSRTARSGPVAA